MANEIAASLGLRVEKVSYTDRPDTRAGSVVEHRPLPGQKVATGDEVALVLAKRETTPLGSVGTFTLFQHRLPSGAGQRRVQVVITNAEATQHIFDEVREAGAEVRLLVKVKGETVAKIYYDGVLVEERRIE
jgi:beta-lactam-binding protein with PASTA domain